MADTTANEDTEDTTDTRDTEDTAHTAVSVQITNVEYTKGPTDT